MSTVTERIAAYGAAVAPVATGELRLGLSDADALALAAELTTLPDGVADPYAAFAAAYTADRPTDPSALAVWATDFTAKRREFWRAFACTVVAGVTIVEKPQ